MQNKAVKKKQRNKKKILDIQKTSKMGDINLTISIKLNINGVNNPIKRHIIKLKKNQDTTMCCLQETHFRLNGRNCASSNHKKAVTSGKMNFKKFF